MIATGGVVTREESYPLPHQNGMIFWIKRDVNLLPKAGWPLTQRRDLAEMYAGRAPLYERFADAVIDNNGTLEDAVQQVIDAFHNQEYGRRTTA